MAEKLIVLAALLLVGYYAAGLAMALADPDNREWSHETLWRLTKDLFRRPRLRRQHGEGGSAKIGRGKMMRPVIPGARARASARWTRRAAVWYD